MIPQVRGLAPFFCLSFLINAKAHEVLPEKWKSRPKPVVRLPGATRRCASNSTGNAWKSAEVPPWKRRDHNGKEAPGRDWQTETQANRCCCGPRKWKRDGDVRRNGYLEEALVPPARCFRSLRDFDEYPHDHPWKTQRNKEPTGPTVPGIREIEAGNDRQPKHYHRKAVLPYDFAPKAGRRAAVSGHSRRRITAPRGASPNDESGGSEYD